MVLGTTSTSTVDVNAALFCDFEDSAFLYTALQPFTLDSRPCVISDKANLLPFVDAPHQIDPASLGLDLVPIDGEQVLAQLRLKLAEIDGLTCVAMDTSWGLGTVHGASSYETWGAVAERLVAEFRVPVFSLFNKEHMIEEQVQAAFRAHRQFLAPSGLYENPYWLPPEMLREANLDEQLSFMLGRVVPDYTDSNFFKDVERLAARGASPDWVTQSNNSVAISSSSTRWHIHCLGRLTVYTGGNEPVDWQVSGGAQKKTRTLFAYLLQNGEKGVRADRIGELLWPDGGAEKTKRARLHHTIAMLRKVLGSQQSIIRSGDYYRLNVPVGSWLDITSFEQLCRRAISLARHAKAATALPVYYSAERLYRGDLFEDLPLEYVQSEHEEWCMPRRIWLREMALRVQYDMSKLLRKEGLTGQALERVQRALALDPTNEDANIEALYVFHDMGRVNAMHRQVKLYHSAVLAMGDVLDGTEIDDVYEDLCRSLNALPEDQRKTKVMTLR